MPAVNVSPTTSTTIVAADYKRTMLVITNADSVANIHLSFGGTATTNDAFIPPQGNMTIAGDRIWKGAINGISSSGTVIAKYSAGSPGS